MRDGRLAVAVPGPKCACEGPSEGPIGPAPASSPSQGPFWVPSFTDILSKCTSTAITGCALAWVFVQSAAGHLHSQKSTLFFTLFCSTAWPRASRKRVALPVRLGELRMVRDRLLESSFAAALQHAFVQEFTEDAWTLLACYACNTLHGQQSPLELGGWSQAEKRVVLSIRGAVKNMLRHSVDMRADLSAIEKMSS